MKTIFSLLLSLAAVLGVYAQCETGFNQSYYETTGTLQAYMVFEGDTLNNPVEAQYVWEVNDATLTGEVITVDFLEDVIYFVCVTGSANGCSSTACDTIYFPSDVNVDSCNMFLSYDITHATNSETDDGAIDITVQGGIAPFSYYWSNEETTEDIDGLFPGTYSVIVMDNDACELTYSFTVTGMNDSTYNDTTVADYIYVDANYFFETEDDCTGNVWAEAYGGTAPYSYLWSNDETTATIYGACGDEFYCVTVTDAEGLEAEACVFVDYYYYQDSTWDVVDSLETAIDTCLDEIVLGEIIDSYVEGNSIIVVWEFTDSEDNTTNITIVYPAEDTITAGMYEVYLYINCGNTKSMTTYSDRIEITPEQLTGILESFDKTSFDIYPNPVSDQLNIEMLSKNYDDASLTIINATGQIVYTENISINDGVNQYRISVENLVSGMYFVKISGNENYETLRFVK